MQRSRESVGALAAALAKAQAEIQNPEKSLTATIVSPFPRGAFAMRHCRRGSIWSASVWVSTRSPPCKPPPSTARAA